MNEKTEICKALRLLEAHRDSLNVQADLGIISIDGAREELNMITRKERELRDRLVTTNHVTEDGAMRAISHHKPTPDNPKEY